jgi:hypothetical protein
MGRSTVFTFIGKDEFSKVAGNVEKSASGMGGKLGKAGMLAAGGLAAAGTAVLAVGAGLTVAAKAALEDEASQAKLARTLKNSAGAHKDQIAAVEAYITKTGMATGVTDDQMRPALARLVRSTGDVGKAQDMMAVAMDASAGTGKSLETVTAAMAKAHDGNTGALGRLGIATKDASGKALSYDQVMANMAQTFKGQTQVAAETTAGTFGRLKLMFDETKEAIGAKLLPILTQMGNWFIEKGVPAIKQMADQVLPVLREAWDSIKRTIDENRPGLEKMGAMLAVVGQVIATKVIPFLVRLWSVELRAVITVIGKVGEALPPMVAGFLSGLATIVGAFRSFYNATTAVLRGILTVASATMGWIPGIGEKITAAKTKFESFREGTNANLGRVESALRGAAGEVDKFNNRTLKDKNATVTVTYKAVYTKAAKAGNPLYRGYPAMASGGIVTRPTIALIGEAGPEAVVPLSRGGGYGSGVTVNVYGGLDSAETIARTVQTALLDLKRRQGVSLGLA